MKRIFIAVSVALMLIPLLIGCHGNNKSSYEQITPAEAKALMDIVIVTLPQLFSLYVSFSLSIAISGLMVWYIRYTTFIVFAGACL